MMFSLFACGVPGPTDASLTEPTLAFLAPQEGDVVDAGEVDVSVVVDDFVLVEPTASVGSPFSWLVPTAWAHGDEGGTPAGYVVLFVDEVEVGQLSTTQGRIEVAPGVHGLRGALRFADGDPLDPPVEAALSFTAQ